MTQRDARRLPTSLLPTLLFLTLISCVTFADSPGRVQRGNLVLDGLPEIPERIERGLLRYENTRPSGFVGWLPGEHGILISTRFGETRQIHHVAAPGGARRQLTFFAEPVGAAQPSSSAEVDGFLFSRDVGGSEFFQLFFQELSTGEHRLLTDGVSRNGGALWSNAGDRFVYYTTARNGVDWDLHIYEVASGKQSPRLTDGGVWFPSAWSPDDRKLTATRYVSANESYPHLIDLDTGERQPLSLAGKRVAHGGMVFSGDGAGLYYVSDEDTDFLQLRYRDLTSGETRLLSGDIPWNVIDLALSKKGDRLAFVTNENGLSRLRVIDTASEAEIELPELPNGQLSGLEFSPNDRQLGFVLNTASSPGDVYSIDIAATKLVRWTHAETGGLASDHFVEPELIGFPTFDSDAGGPSEVPAFYYRPQGDGPFPVLVQIHGGPEGQARPFFDATIQYYVNELGIAVLVPNVRGSAGYGKSYLLLDNGFRREDSVRDIGALLDWIAERSDLDAERVAVIGGSYGGYMVLASLTHYNDRLRAGIDIVGISNFVTFLENTKSYRRDLRRVEYGDERDPEMRRFLEKISPTTNATKITKPLFVAQGLNDPRVPASESEQMVEVIRAGGGEVWYFLAEDEGHGFKKKVNRDYYRRAVVLFLEQYLMGDE